MTIIQNKPVYPFKEGHYCKPHHIVVKGSWEEIGFDLGKLAKSDYDVKLVPYCDEVYGKARREYMAANAPHVAEMQKGVFRAYGLPEDCDKFDGTNLPFDWYLTTRTGLASFGTANFCSGLCLPKEKSEGGPYVARNMDFAPVVEWYTALGKEAPEGTFGAFERGIVLEFQPDTGYKTICSGPNELMMPWGDGINEKGLWMTCMYDPQGGGINGSPPVGGDVSGLVMTQLHQVILTTCATVAEAKKAILKNRIMQTMMPLHMPIVDATGACTVFEIDIHGSYTFSDRKAGEPIFSTNHPIHVYPTPDTYPKHDMSHEHNTYTRQIILRDAYSKMKPPFKLEDAEKLIGTVHCAFLDDVKAECQPIERTLANVKADLSKPEMSIRWFWKDVAPIPGTNQMKDCMSDFYTFGF